MFLFLLSHKEFTKRYLDILIERNEHQLLLVLNVNNFNDLSNDLALKYSLNTFSRCY